MSEEWRQQIRKRDIRELRAIARPVAEQYGCALHEAGGAYELFRIKGRGIQIIVYPHRTSARNYHARVRDSGSKDAARADALMSDLDKAAGYNCTFTRKLR